ncbi:MAG TPA: hypothetical protein VNT32_11965 [Thermoleophilaceae bacterium]|nr:hypothetical protein [Thermoleophilaceae bacterium]
MPRSQRLGLIAVAAVIAVAAFALLSDGEDDSMTPGDASTAPATSAAGPTTPTVPAAPATPTIRIGEGKPVGGVVELEAEKGGRIRFRVRSDAAHEIHLHGYDVVKKVRAGGSVTFDQKANIEGIFEVEVEELGEQIAKLTVNP